MQMRVGPCYELSGHKCVLLLKSEKGQKTRKVKKFRGWPSS